MRRLNKQRQRGIRVICLMPLLNFIAMRHLNTADISASYGVLRVRAAVLIAAIMAVLVSLAEPTLVITTLRQPSRPPPKLLRKLTRRLNPKPEQLPNG